MFEQRPPYSLRHCSIHVCLKCIEVHVDALRVRIERGWEGGSRAGLWRLQEEDVIVVAVWGL